MAVYNINGNPLSSIYNVGGTSVPTGYDVQGDIVFTERVVPVDYDDYTMTQLYSVGFGSTQGMAIHNNVIFQFRASGSTGDKVCLFDFSNGQTIATDIAIKSDHGDSATFSREYYASGDEFPLLYVSADTSPAKIYINRVRRTSSTLIKTLVFPASAGYYGAGAFDWDNNICYILAYKQQNYQTDGGGANTTVISKWDLSNLTDNGDDTYTPAFISQYERPFIYVMQGLAYHDGLLWVASGYGNADSHVYALNPTDGTLEHTITLNTYEIEGIDFVYDTTAQSYYMVTSQLNSGSTYYKKYTFAPLE